MTRPAESYSSTRPAVPNDTRVRPPVRLCTLPPIRVTTPGLEAYECASRAVRAASSTVYRSTRDSYGLPALSRRVNAPGADIRALCCREYGGTGESGNEN